MVWAALIIGVCSGVLFLGSTLVWRPRRLTERLVGFWRSPRDEQIDPAEERALAERLDAFDALREELLLRAIRAKAESDVDTELDAFRRASERFLQLAAREIRGGEPRG